MGKIFGQKIKQELDRLGLSMYRLSKMTGISSVQIGRLVDGSRAPTDSTILKISNVLSTLPFSMLREWALEDKIGTEAYTKLKETYPKPPDEITEEYLTKTRDRSEQYSELFDQANKNIDNDAELERICNELSQISGRPINHNNVEAWIKSEASANPGTHPLVQKAHEERHTQLMAQLDVVTTPEEIKLIADELKKLAKEMGHNTEELDQRHKRGGYTLTQVLEATDGGGMIKLPVYGLASCGSPTYIEDHPEEYQSWPAIMAKDADGILVVRGQSMEGVGYRDGDLIFVRRIDGEQPNSGEKVIASIDGDYTCKIYRHDEMGDYLEAAYANDKTWRIAIRPGISLVAIVTWHASRESR